MELPRLDRARCTGWGLCVAVCPTHCLETAGAEPVLARPADCVSCGLCVRVCPEQALAMAEVEAGDAPG